jgi:hypothetical protein
MGLKQFRECVVGPLGELNKTERTCSKTLGKQKKMGE